MPHHDETQLRHLQIRVQQELFQARADLERQSASSSQETDLGDRLEQIEREITKLRQSHGLLFRGRRTQALLALLFSERLVLDDLGYDSYEDYLSADVEGRSVAPDADAAYAELARLELASAQDRLDDIENGVLDLDWLADGCPELSLVEPLEPYERFSAPVGDQSSGTGAPLEAWLNPFAVEPGPSPTAERRTQLPCLDRDGSPVVELPYWNETA